MPRGTGARQHHEGDRDPRAPEQMLVQEQQPRERGDGRLEREHDAERVRRQPPQRLELSDHGSADDRSPTPTAAPTSCASRNDVRRS